MQRLSDTYMSICTFNICFVYHMRDAYAMFQASTQVDPDSSEDEPNTPCFNQLLQMRRRCTYIHIHIYTYTHIYIYIYVFREFRVPHAGCSICSSRDAFAANSIMRFNSQGVQEHRLGNPIRSTPEQGRSSGWVTCGISTTNQANTCHS